MANYNSIEEIIAGVENTTQLVNNTKYDDNSYTIDGVPAFVKYKGGTYTVAYEPIRLQQSTIIKYLIRDSGKLYTVTDGELSEITGTLSADLFQNSGFDGVPDGALLVSLTSPEVLCWTNNDTVPILTATVHGTPTGTHDIISDNINIGNPSIFGIASIDAIATNGATFLLSFDSGDWMAYNGVEWVASNVGMTASELVSIPVSAWNSVINSYRNMKLKAIIEGEGTVTEVKFNFNNSPVTSNYTWGYIAKRYTWSQVDNYTWQFFKGV